MKVLFFFLAMTLPASACNISLAHTYHVKADHLYAQHRFLDAGQANMLESNLLNTCPAVPELVESASSLSFAGSDFMLAGHKSTGIAEIRLAQLMLTGIISLHPEIAKLATEIYDDMQEMIDDGR